MKPSRPSKKARTHILISNNLKARRLAKNVTQSDIAESLGIARGTYATFECGACLPHTTILEGITRYLDCKDVSIYAGVYLDIIRMESD